MRTFMLSLGGLALMGAAEPPETSPPSQPVPALRVIEPLAPPPEHCRDQITKAREDAGKSPLLDRAPASPDKPYHIYAVDKRIDGCAVMVMHGDVTDFRPLPERPEGPILLMPAKDDQ